MEIIKGFIIVALLIVLIVVIICMIKKITIKQFFESIISIIKEKLIKRKADHSDETKVEEGKAPRKHPMIKTENNKMLTAELVIESLGVNVNGEFYPVPESKLYLSDIVNTDHPEIPCKYQYIIGRKTDKSKELQGRTRFRYIQAGDRLNTVSREHLCIIQNDKGYFAKSITETSQTLIQDSETGFCKSVDSFEIKDGTIAKLGMQWVIFRVVSPYGKIMLKELL